MFEIFSLIGAAVVIYITYWFFKFIRFKRKLIGELERLGLGYEEADMIYTSASNFAHAMHNDGHSPSEIALAIFNAISRRTKQISSVHGGFSASGAKEGADMRKLADESHELLNEETCEKLHAVKSLLNELCLELTPQGILLSSISLMNNYS